MPKRFYTSSAGPGLGLRTRFETANWVFRYAEARDAEGALSSFVVNAFAMDHVAINTIYGDTIDTKRAPGIVYGRASDWTRHVLMPDVQALGLRYTSFAVWQTGMGSATGEIAAMAFGDRIYFPTPALGAASFKGKVAGVYLDPLGWNRQIVGDVDLKVDFSSYLATSFYLQSSDMRDLDGVAYPDLVLQGTGSVQQGRFTGVQFQTARLIGPGEIDLYGPVGDEAGGNFTLAPKTGDGLERFIGAFASRRTDVAPPAIQPPAAPFFPEAPAATFPLPTGFTRWSNAVASSAPVEVSGKSLERIYQANGSGVFDISPVSGVMDAAVTETFNAVGSPTSFKAQNNNRSASFYTAYGDTLTPSPGAGILYARASDWTRQALVANARSLGWDYQSFGVWQTGIGSGTGSIGATSYGAATPINAIPRNGTGFFTGSAAGLYVDQTGRETMVTGQTQMNVDFDVRAVSIVLRSWVDRQGMNMDNRLVTGGLASWEPGKNQFQGKLENTPMVGAISGQFFGPTGQEIGGVFNVNGPGLESFVGAFGAKRQY